MNDDDFRSLLTCSETCSGATSKPEKQLLLDQLLDAALKTAPEGNLAADFASRASAQLELEKATSQDIFLVISAILCMSLALAVLWFTNASVAIATSKLIADFSEFIPGRQPVYLQIVLAIVVLLSMEKLVTHLASISGLTRHQGLSINS